MSEIQASTKIKMKKVLSFFRNKYIFILTVFVIYGTFLDDDDIFSIISQNRKLHKIHKDQELYNEKLGETRGVLKNLHQDASLERYAREQKLFKKDNEEIFIISYE